MRSLQTYQIVWGIVLLLFGIGALLLCLDLPNCYMQTEMDLSVYTNPKERYLNFATWTILSITLVSVMIFGEVICFFDSWNERTNNWTETYPRVATVPVVILLAIVSVFPRIFFEISVDHVHWSVWLLVIIATIGVVILAAQYSNWFGDEFWEYWNSINTFIFLAIAIVLLLFNNRLVTGEFWIFLPVPFIVWYILRLKTFRDLIDRWRIHFIFSLIIGVFALFVHQKVHAEITSAPDIKEKFCEIEYTLEWQDKVPVISFILPSYKDVKMTVLDSTVTVACTKTMKDTIFTNPLTSSKVISSKLLVELPDSLKVKEDNGDLSLNPRYTCSFKIYPIP